MPIKNATKAYKQKFMNIKLYLNWYIIPTDSKNQSSNSSSLSKLRLSGFQSTVDTSIKVKSVTSESAIIAENFDLEKARQEEEKEQLKNLIQEKLRNKFRKVIVKKPFQDYEIKCSLKNFTYHYTRNPELVEFEEGNNKESYLTA